MALKTFYWNSRKVSQLEYLKHKWLHRPLTGFKYGNVGDIFNEDLIKFLYKESLSNERHASGKLLLVGSIASVIKPNDIVCGIGWKGNDLSSIATAISKTKVYGVRGPLTRTLFEKYGADLSEFKFEYDPGLLIKDVLGLNLKTATTEDVLFIPHYKDKNVYSNRYPEVFKVVDVDAQPIAFCKALLKAKVVYSSSLHGIIFGHALGKPCVFVAPQSDEPLFKYKDYFLSIGQEMPHPLKSIKAYNFKKDTETSLGISVSIDDFYFPTRSELVDKKIIFKP